MDTPTMDTPDNTPPQTQTPQYADYQEFRVVGAPGEYDPTDYTTPDTDAQLAVDAIGPAPYAYTTADTLTERLDALQRERLTAPRRTITPDEQRDLDDAEWSYMRAHGLDAL